MQTLPERVARAAMQVIPGYLAIAVCDIMLSMNPDPWSMSKKGYKDCSNVFFFKGDDCMLTIFQMYPYLYRAHTV